MVVSVVIEAQEDSDGIRSALGLCALKVVP